MPVNREAASPGNYPGRWMVFGIGTSFFLLSQFYRATVAVITPQLTHELGIDSQGLALLSAAFFYAFALAQIPLSLYLDRLGARRTMIALNLVGIVGALTFASAQSLSALILARALLGIGMASNLMGTFKLLAAWFSPQRFATLGGLVFSVSMLGSLAAATPLVILTQTMGWRGAFALFAGLNLLLTAILWMKIQDMPPGSVQASDTPVPGKGGLGGLFQAITILLKKRDYWIISLAAGFRYGIFAAFQALYAGPYLMTTRGFSPLVAGNIILAMNLGVIAGGPIFGWVSDRVLHSRKKVIIGGLLGMVLALSGCGLAAQQGGALVMAILFTLLGIFSSFTALLYTHIKEQVSFQQAGAAMTGINFFTMLAPGVVIQGMGFWMAWRHPADALGTAAFKETFLVCSAILAAVAAVYLVTRDTRAD